jgi:hypothetical protein
MEDLMLSSMIGQFRMIATMNHIEHDRSGTEIEGDTTAHMKVGGRAQCKLIKPTLFDFAQSDGRPLSVTPGNLGITPQAAILKDRRQAIDMDDMDNFAAREEPYSAPISIDGESFKTARVQAMGTKP